MRWVFAVVTAVAVMLTATLYVTQYTRERHARLGCQLHISILNGVLHHYRDRTGDYPPLYSIDREGKPLLSWRVLILPEFGHQALYNQFHLDEPWDSPHNATLIAKMPNDYYCDLVSRDRPGHTPYLGVRQSRNHWFIPESKDDPGFPIQELPSPGVEWTSPTDDEYCANYLRAPIKHHHRDFHAIGMRPGNDEHNLSLLKKPEIPKLD